MASPHGPLRVGVGGPVGSGKTALMDALCKALRGRYEIAAITNDIYTKWDAEYLVRSGALAPERIAGVETGGCPHTAIREDASINLAAVADMRRKFPALDLVLIESGGDNLAATFSPELADITIYVIDVAAGDDFASQQSGDEKSGQHEEDVHADVTAREQRDSRVEGDDHEDRHAAETFDVRPESLTLGHSLYDTRNRLAKLPGLRPAGP